MPKWAATEQVAVRRGFPAGINTTANKIMRNASALASRSVINDIFPRGMMTVAEAQGIAASPLAPRLRTFRSQNHDLPTLQPLLAAATGLTGLALYFPLIWNPGPNAAKPFTDLFATGNVLRIARLGFCSAPISQAELAAFSSVPFTALRELSFAGGQELPAADLA